MSAGVAFKIIGAVLALGIGIYLGMPGRDDRSIEEIEEIMASGTARRKTVKKRFTPMAWMKRQTSVRTRGSAGNRQGRGFSLDSPDER